MIFVGRLPEFIHPVTIHFHWIESNKRRDLDNICFAKKFILDALVKSGKLKDDNRKCVTAFTDTFEYGDETKVVLDIKEQNLLVSCHSCTVTCFIQAKRQLFMSVIFTELGTSDAK